MNDLTERYWSCDHALPCPFCGGEAQADHMESGRWDIACTNDNCLAGLTWGSFARQSEAIEAWNIRTPDLQSELTAAKARIAELETTGNKSRTPLDDTTTRL